MAQILMPMAMLSLLSIGAIFGFFYAWVCSTMWGLDAVDPKTAITAMQAMNASVRNLVFFPGFFGTLFFLAITALVVFGLRRRRPAFLLAASAAVYVLGALAVTTMIHVPMNEALAEVAIPADRETAQQIWEAYSPRWQFWNILRTIACGLALAMTGYAIFFLRDADAK